MPRNSVVRARLIGFLTAVTIAALPILLGSTASSSDEGRGSGSVAERSVAADIREIAAASPPKPADREQNMAGDFFEVLLKWTPSGADSHVREWLERQGLTAMPMKAGMLTLASRSQIEKAFGVSLEDAQPPFELPIPEELRPYLSAVTVLKPRSYH
jgi:hypothetical protein